MSIEGSPYSNLINMMRQEGYNKDVDLIVGKVTSLNPLKIKLQNFEITEEDFILSQNLKEHERKITLEAVTVNGQTSVTDNHSHNLQNFNILEGKITFKSPLEIDDLVIVIRDQNEFYVLDKVV